MRYLFHHALCPFSRIVRLALIEKKLDFSLEVEPFWERRPNLLKLNALGEIPVFIDLNGTIVSDSGVISEYLDEAYPESLILGNTIFKKTEIRRLVSWFNQKFAQDVSWPLIYEKLYKRLFARANPSCKQASSGPDSAQIRHAKLQLGFHLDYIGWLVERRNWLAGDDFSLADLSAAAHLSVIDFLGDIPWDKYEEAKNWYGRIKSRPSFRPLLHDVFPGITAAPHYNNLDF